VSGSDVILSPITHELADKGIQIFEGQSADHVSKNADLLVFSSAISEDNPERVKARELGIPEMTYAQALGEISKGYFTIAVSGTHGKSTTTAMIGLILEAADLDPTVIVGSRVPSFTEKNLRVGGGKYFVVEGCEYRANMLSLHPSMIVLTNIEEDHLDYYRDLNHICKTFQTFVEQVGEGVVVWNADDQQSRKLSIAHGVNYGLEKGQYQARERRCDGGKQYAGIWKGEQRLGEIVLAVPGAHNISNALAAITASMELGVSFETCAKTLADFRGIWRRFELISTWKGAQVISDYGHHPTEITATLRAVRELYPHQRMVLCFQPHQHARTLAFKQEFAQVISEADLAIIPEIYEVAGRTEGEEISSRELVTQAQKIAPQKMFLYAQDKTEARKLLEKLVQKDDILLVQGAGDIDDLARALI
jgi:UDP-N-acetylmuramate--alanine ligase